LLQQIDSTTLIDLGGKIDENVYASSGLLSNDSILCLSSLKWFYSGRDISDYTFMAFFPSLSLYSAS